MHCLLGYDACFLQYSYYRLFQKTVAMRISVLARKINGPAGKGRSQERIMPEKEENPLIATFNNFQESSVRSKK